MKNSSPQNVDTPSASPEEYRILFEKNPHPMWVYDQQTWRFLAVNDAAVSFYGYSREEFLRMTIMDMRPPEHVPALRKFVTRELAGPVALIHSSGIWIHWKKDRTLIEVEIFSSRIVFQGHPAVLVLAVDVTERTKVESMLRDSELRFRGAFDFAPVGMGLLDLTGRIHQVNRAMCEMMGYTYAEYSKLSMQDVTHPDDVEPSWQLIRLLINGQIPYLEQEKRYIHKTGRIIWASVRGSLVRDEAGKPIYLVGHVQDITLQKLAEAERTKLFQELATSRNNLQQLSRKLVQVQEAERRRIALELHDQVGQELTVLKLNLERCQECFSSDTHNVLEETHARASRLLSMVRDLSLDLRPTMLDDLGLLHAMLWYLERFKTSSGLSIDFKHRGIGHRRFAAEVETAAFRIVQEALTNVARHARAKEVRIWLWASKERLTITIEDKGVGFDAEAMLSASTSTGLSGMRERAALLGGTFSLESAVGRGTSLTAELPLQDKAGEQVTQ